MRIEQPADYRSFLYYNHLRAANQAGAFNPGMLLRFNSGATPFQDFLVDMHERRHAVLAASVYGRIILLLRFMSIDALAFWASEDQRTGFADYWSFTSTCLDLVGTLVGRWILTHEGLATFQDWRYLQTQDSEEAAMLKRVLLTVFEDENSPYRRGFDLVRQFGRTFEVAYISAIVHEIGNLAVAGLAANDPELFLKTLRTMSPDAVLSDLADVFSRADGTRFIEQLPATNYTQPIRQYFEALGYPLHPGLTSRALLFDLLGLLPQVFDMPARYRVRLASLLERQREFWPTNQAYHSTRLMFNAQYVAENGYQRVLVKSDGGLTPSSTEKLIQEVQTLCNLDAWATAFLPQNPEGYAALLAEQAAWYGVEQPHILLFNAFQ